jgi:acyl-CoA dehydrogenase
MIGPMTSLFDHLLTAAPTPDPCGDVASWWQQHQALVGRFSHPAELAAAGGFAADRLGWAFASGYHAALCSLLPEHPRDEKTALCATEAKGGHPRHIHCRLQRVGDGFILNGRKSFVTLGTDADRFLIVASEGVTDDGRNRLRVVRIDRRPGLTVVAAPILPFVPEIPHAALELSDVAVSIDEVLPGDGYLRVLKPFRTIEDLHVHAGLLGWLVQVGRRSGWPPETIEEALLILAAILPLAEGDPSSPGVHRALGGVLAASKRLVSGLEPLWSTVDVETRERWARDQPLLGIASTVRAARLERARS